MDIDYVLRSFEIPRDRPLWEAALLARLCSEEAASQQARQAESKRAAVILPFRRPDAV